ncbi:MAG TPA: hypothetical protein PKE35_04480 [Anaerolineales bacterium]|nr:hypothetical protein [Anaerolineales bacterium]HMZ41980.1 hypothetical protein [Anaerolineales bacterium]HND91057.1 hypothetical protein [Anaerolineales bacterium]HNE68250.1 hypothetical protein [Anaerolineales bacterium]HNF33689.1 hypothetical protein [Anaerolineales bacterium]
MKQDRFLTGILAGIGVLILLALVLFFVRQDDTKEYRVDASPEATVYNYVLAITNDDYQKAYSYLAEKEHKPSYEQFRQSFFNGNVSPDNVGVDVGTAEISEDDALVNLSLVYSPNDPFFGGYSSTDRAQLIRQNGEWKLTYMPYNFWSYDWYQEQFK